jgi:hypothetical protein
MPSRRPPSGQYWQVVVGQQAEEGDDGLDHKINAQYDEGQPQEYSRDVFGSQLF